MGIRLRRLDLYHVVVPLRTKIAHASHERRASDNLVVRATLDDGTIGYGEGVPREYVTGETVQTCLKSLSGFDAAAALGSPSDWVGVVQALESLELPENLEDSRGMAANAARCALELAILDACGRRFGVGVGEAVRVCRWGRNWVRPEPGAVRYSGAITASEPGRERVSAWKMRLYGFRDVKVKVAVPGQDDVERLAVFRRIMGRRRDIRLDANEGWRAEELSERVGPLRQFGPSVLEQPVPHREVGRLAEWRGRLGVAVMLDESMCGWPDGQRAVREGLCDLFNVRLSKCGGLIPTLRLLDLAWREGLGAQLGCHPGETGLLSAAGRHLAANVRGLRYVEGSYDRHVLAENLIREDVTFGYGGWSRPLPGPGLGVTVDEGRLERLSQRREEVDYG
ncbi:MAG: dipeptide epimerase [Isosphaeraceae bacterium]|nr:MAG: dipeptide epimerase [Isosphaeraceae bacterium]